MSYRDKKWLYNQYIILEQSTTQIAQEVGVGISTINSWIKKNNIKIRSLSEGRKLAMKQGRIKPFFEKGNVYRKGLTPWNKGLKGIHFSSQTEWKKGDQHPHWKGENASNSEKHHWVKEYKERQLLCEWCKEEKKLYLSFDHSKGNATRNLNDYIWLCKKCHMKRDKSFGIYDFKKQGMKKIIENDYGRWEE